MVAVLVAWLADVGLVVGLVEGSSALAVVVVGSAPSSLAHRSAKVSAPR